MEERDDHKFMRRCLELASCAGGMTYPNPLVGSVVVHDGKIIGEGYHQRAGMPHAEVNAINSVSEKYKLKESTLYVNLEPCSHYGKTPPCADLIIASAIPRVVIGAVDTSSKVGGRGIEKLKQAGVNVVTGVLEDESRWLNRRFFSFHERKRPWIILKWAQSPDGFIDLKRNPETDISHAWISGKPERVLVHKWRSLEQAILVGAGTIRADKPKLNVREWRGNSPLVLVLSSSGTFDAGSIEGRFVVFTHNRETSFRASETIFLNNEEPSCIQIANYLFEAGLQSLFIEGGSQLLTHFIGNNMWDEARIFTGRNDFVEGVPSPAIQGNVISEQDFEGSSLRFLTNKNLKDLQIRIKS